MCDLVNARQSSGCATRIQRSRDPLEIRSTIFTNPIGGVIVAAVVFKFHLSLLQKLACAIVAAPLLCVAAENAAHQKSPEASPSTGAFDAHAAERFAKLALQCVHKEYPNKISHVLNSEADVAAPCKLTPAFCGCYDWHSSVHGHWLLVRLLRTFPDASIRKSRARRFEGEPHR